MRFRGAIFIYSLFLLIFAIFSTGASAQPAAGTVKGVLTDDSGAVIPAASVTLSGNGASRNGK